MQGASLEWLNKNDLKKLETIKKLYEQQKYMYENKKKTVEKRIVSLNQPYVRPIVRGIEKIENIVKKKK